MRTILAAATIALLAACGNGDDANADTDADTASPPAIASRPATASSPAIAPAGDPINVEVEGANWTFAVTGYHTTETAQDLTDDYTSRVPVPGKRYAVTTIDA